MKVFALGNRVEVHGAPPLVERELRTRLTVPNPRYVGAVRAGKTPIGIDKVLHYWKQSGDIMTLPAACAGMATEAARRHGVQFAVEARIPEHPPVGLEFRGVERLYQTLAVAELCRFDHGVLDAPTGSGKTIMGCARIAAVDRKTLVIVHNKLLAEQWFAAVDEYLGVDAGVIGGGISRGLHSPVIVGIINSISSRLGNERDSPALRLCSDIGHVLVDECHRVVGGRYWHALGHFNCRHRTGLTATPYRSDGRDDAIQWALGRIVKVQRAPLIKSGAILPAEIEQIGTDFTTQLDASTNYKGVMDELVANEARNAQIAMAAIEEKGGPVLILTDRVEHSDRLARMTCGMPIHGQLGAVQRGRAEIAIKRAREGHPVTLVATTQTLGEGFDLPAAQALLLAMPIKFSGRLMQAIGRVLRPADGKTAGRILDFCDWRVPVLAGSARARLKAYRRLAEEEKG